MKTPTLPPAEEMHRILTNTPAGTTATTPMGTFLVRRITDVMTEILQNENSQDTPSQDTLSQDALLHNNFRPCQLCSLEAYHHHHDVCPLFSACTHRRLADNESVVFC